MNSPAVLTDVTCAVEVFIATALLHREQPSRLDFSIQEIVSRAARENMTGEMRQGVSVHASQHCVANKAPNPARHKMLFATDKHNRRLLLPGDEVHPQRTGKIFPDPGELPERYLSLLDWAKSRYESARNFANDRDLSSSGNFSHSVTESKSADRWLESLFELEGLGKEHWKGIDPDEYVRQLREGWE
ncbi:MAG: hypothetical protein ABSE46_05905 [Terracidiphilus sp.]|jgi:hypothetical protein